MKTSVVEPNHPLLVPLSPKKRLSLIYSPPIFYSEKNYTCFRHFFLNFYLISTAYISSSFQFLYCQTLQTEIEKKVDNKKLKRQVFFSDQNLKQLASVFNVFFSSSPRSLCFSPVGVCTRYFDICIYFLLDICTRNKF